MVPLLVLAAIALSSPSTMATNIGTQASPSRLASASATATVQILTPAMIGEGLAAPQAGMQPRPAIDPAGSNLLMVYDFE